MITIYLLQQKQIAELETELDALQNELNMFGVRRFCYIYFFIFM